MIKIIIILAYVLACFIWGNWRNWREYYPTILYVIIGDFAYNFLFFNFSLWEYEKFLNHTFCDIIIAFTIFPSAIILFFTFLPQKFLRRFLYILMWTVSNTALEYFCYVNGYLSYSNNWNIIWSAAVYFIAFIMVTVHFKHPLMTWLISGCLAIATMLFFKIPFSMIK